MKLNQDEHKLTEHMAEGRRLAREDCEKTADLDVLWDMRIMHHAIAAWAWADGDVVKHRIHCIAANEVVDYWQQAKKAKRA